MNQLKFLFLIFSLIMITACEENGGSSSSRYTNSHGHLPPEAVEALRTGDFTRAVNNATRGPTADYCPNCTESRDQPQVALSRTGSQQQLLNNFTRLGGDPVAFEQAMCFLRTHGNTRFRTPADGYNSGIRIEQQRYVTINDLTKPSTHKRLFILDRQTGEVRAYHSGHGSGTDSNPNTHEVIRNFSNVNGSHTNPRGFFITGNTYQSNKDFGEGIRLHGLQRGINDNSIERGIVIHKADYTPAGVARSSQANPRLTGSRSGRSHGCTTVNDVHYPEVRSILSSGIEERGDARGGSLYYNYSPTERSLGAGYCGNNLVTR
jgi:hypothetical protein